MRSKFWAAAAGAALVVSLAGSAAAATITKTFSFAGTGFVGFVFGTPAPIDPLIGSVTVTFDPTLFSSNETSGITLNSLNFSLGSAISFNYNPWLDQIAFGGANVSTIAVAPGTDDFALDIRHASSATPEYFTAIYTRAATPREVWAGTLSAHTPSVAVPEPAVWSLMILGFGASGAMLRRGRRPKPALPL
jgi:hypothetical protein